MTFPFLPHRSSSDDESLDQQLNEWATGSHTEPASDEAADALEFHRWADNTRRSDPAATGPAAGTWNRVLRNSAQESSKRSSTMSSVTLGSQSTRISAVPKDPVRQSIRHFTNLAATIALVLAVAVGGWLAMMRVNQPVGGPEPRFAALALQPEDAGNGVCDVEPLTVDESIAIMKDPLATLVPDVDEAIESGFSEDLFGRGQAVEPLWNIPFLMTAKDWASVGMLPATLEELTPVANEYLDCVHTGSRGQIWRLKEPLSVQYELYMSLPTLASEAEASELLPSILGTRYSQSPLSAFYDPDTETLMKARINPDPSNASYFAMSSYADHISGFGMIPISFSSEDGAVLAVPNLEGQSIEAPDQEVSFAINIVIGKSSLDGQYYVFDIFDPHHVPVYPEE